MNSLPENIVHYDKTAIASAYRSNGAKILMYSPCEVVMPTEQTSDSNSLSNVFVKLRMFYFDVKAKMVLNV